MLRRSYAFAWHLGGCSPKLGESQGATTLDANRARRQDRKLDLAARAAWLYYIAHNTQDEIAEKLNVSRQAVQRLVSLAVSEKLIKFRLDHPLAATMALAEALRARFGLGYVRVEPADPAHDNPIPGIAIGAAEYLGTFLAQRSPLVLAFATGRTLRALVEEVPAMSCPQHKMVSLVGDHEGEVLALAASAIDETTATRIRDSDTPSTLVQEHRWTLPLSPSPPAGPTTCLASH